MYSGYQKILNKGVISIKKKTKNKTHVMERNKKKHELNENSW